MKQLILSIILILLVGIIPVFTQSDCIGGVSINQLTINNVNVNPSINNIWYNTNENKGYLFPKEGNPLLNAMPLGAAGLWIGGYDSSNELSVLAATYGTSNGNTSYWPGPLDAITGTTTSEACTNWDQHFSTSSEDIELFLADWSDGQIDNAIPTSLLAWPAKGNPFFEDIHTFNLPTVTSTSELAPFWDENEDGIYNPEDGDFPIIPSAENASKYADQMTFWITNGAGNLATETNSLPIPLELHTMAYAFNDLDVEINNTIFYHTKMLYRGQETLDSVYTSLWIDPSFGGACIQEHVGGLPEENMMFFYNGSLEEECPANIVQPETYPMVGIKLLRTPLAAYTINENGELILSEKGQTPDTLVETQASSFMVYENAIFGNPPSNKTDPLNKKEHYHYMKGLYRDASPVIYQGETTKFMYSGNPSDEEAWSMCTEELPIQDRRVLMSVGPFNFSGGSLNQFEFCVTGVENISKSCPDMGVLVEAINEVEEFHDNNSLSNDEAIIINAATVKIAPNPMINQTVISLDDSTNQIQKLRLFNVAGKLIREELFNNQQEIKIVRNNLKTGIYFYQLITTNQQIHTGKLIIL